MCLSNALDSLNYSQYLKSKPFINKNTVLNVLKHSEKYLGEITYFEDLQKFLFRIKQNLFSPFVLPNYYFVCYLLFIKLKHRFSPQIIY